MRRLTQPRVSCYYSLWRTGPPVLPPSLLPFLPRSFSPVPFHCRARAKRPFVSTRGPRALSTEPDFDAGLFIRWIRDRSASFGYCFSGSHARGP